jgi:tyrosyl-tRNA synthetase
MSGFADDLRFRRLVHQVTGADLLQRLDGDPITVYAGFDPSANSLHVGNLLQLCTLRRFQLAGHRPIALAGGATGMIGDPGGKSDERTLLTPDALRANLEGIRPQLERFVDTAPTSGGEAGRPPALVLDNSAWLSPMSVVDFLRDVGKHFTVNQMVAKESVRARFARPDQGISYTEFSYMLLQAYDFLRLHDDHGCTLQIGGSDQWGNITMGVELVRKVARAEVHGLTTPLLVKADGTKFGKSESGTVWLDPARTSPYRLYQFFLQTEDAVVGDLLRSLTFLPADEITALDDEVAERPGLRSAARALAGAVCRLVHGETETDRAERASAALFGGDLRQLDEATLLDVFEDAPSGVVARSGLVDGSVTLVGVLVDSALVASRAEARRTIDQGGAYVNNLRQDDRTRVLGPDDLLCGRYVVLRKGRRDHHLLRVE